MDQLQAACSRLIDAPSDVCLDAISDFSSYPSWQTSVRSCAVEERDELGRGTVVRTVLDLKIRRISYRLRYQYPDEHSLTWVYVDGDVRDIEGRLTCRPSSRSRTLATFVLDIDPGRFVPGLLRDRMQTLLMQGALDDLAHHVEHQMVDDRATPQLSR